MQRYEPQTDTARAMRDFAEEILVEVGGKMGPVLKAMATPIINTNLDNMLRQLDEDPNPHRESLRPFLQRLVLAFYGVDIAPALERRIELEVAP